MAAAPSAALAWRAAQRHARSACGVESTRRGWSSLAPGVLDAHTHDGDLPLSGADMGGQGQPARGPGRGGHCGIAPGPGVASPIICRSALAIEAHRGFASLANTARYGLRDAPCAALRWLRAAYAIRSVTRHSPSC